MQSRLLSLLEAIANVVAGFVLSFLLQLVLFAALGIPASIGQNLAITAIFSAFSLARSYVLRRLFNGRNDKARLAVTPQSGEPAR